MDQEHKLKKEEKKKSKITGRFLIRGVVEILSDTFAPTGDWVCDICSYGRLGM